MEFINACGGLARFNGRFSEEVWTAYASSISPRLAEKVKADIGEYNFQRDVLPVVQAALENPKGLEEVSKNFTSLAGGLHEKFTEKFHLDLDGKVILYLGLCSGAGWATELDGGKAVLLGIEKILGLGWQKEEELQSLIAHELGHLLHDSIGKFSLNTEDSGERGLWQLYREGFAMACEQILCDDRGYYHQNRNGWLDWCLKNEGDIKAEYFNRLQEGESIRDFFGDWCSYKGYSDVGYFLGSRFVWGLIDRLGFKKTANLEIGQLKEAFSAYVKPRGVKTVNKF